MRSREYKLKFITLLHFTFIKFRKKKEKKNLNKILKYMSITEIFAKFAFITTFVLIMNQLTTTRLIIYLKEAYVDVSLGLTESDKGSRNYSTSPLDAY